MPGTTDPRDNGEVVLPFPVVVMRLALPDMPKALDEDLMGLGICAAR